MQQAHYLAHLILTWHQQFGKERIHQLPPDVVQGYLAKIAYFQAHQLSTREVIREIADEQIKGVFEYFYSEKIPSALLDQFSHNIANESLGDIALAIRQLLREGMETPGEPPQELSHIFSLPDGWQERAIQLHPFSVNLHQKSGETIGQTLEAYFAPLADTKGKGVGGRELMVSMNEDLLNERNNISSKGVITAYSPASFGFRLATGENSFVTQIMQGDITVIQVTLGDYSPHIESYEQEV